MSASKSLSFQGSGQIFPSRDPRRADGWDASCLGWRLVEGLRLRLRQKKMRYVTEGKAVGARTVQLTGGAERRGRCRR